MTRLLAVILVLTSITLAVGVRDPFAGLEDTKSLHVKPAKNSKKNRIALQTPYGRINIRLLRDNAPQAAEAVHKLATENGCDDCQFYRAEARPLASKGQQPEGPPYALLQGQMNLPAIPAMEGDMEVQAGHLAFIPGTSDFFIALADHSEWGKSHTVFAELENWVSTDLIAIQPFHEVTHPEHGTVMRMINDPVPFTVDLDVDSF